MNAQAPRSLARPYIRSLIYAAAIFIVSGARGQTAPDEHAAHHPQAGASPGTAGPVPSAGGAKSGGCCMQTPSPVFYPTMIELPALTDAQRKAMLEETRGRMESSAQRALESTRGLLPLAPHDHQTMRDAAARARQALSEYAAAVEAHRALKEERPPREVALAWFRREMNLPNPQSGQSGTVSLFGLTVAHYLAMLFMAGFSAAAVWLRVARRRRARALLNQLRTGSLSVPANSVLGERAGTPSVSAPVRVPASVTGNWSGTLRVARIFDEAPGVKTFRLAAMVGNDLPFMFEPGQFLTLVVPAASGRASRSYSIASSPCCHGWCDVTVRQVPGGVVSTFLHERIKAGDSLDASGPYGRFTFSGRGETSVVMIAGGIGITPLMSAIRYLTDQSWDGDIFLVYATTRLDHAVFREELAHLAHRHPNLHLVWVLSQEPSTDWSGYRGHVTAEIIAAEIPDIAHRRIHLCGPPSMMDTVKAALTALKVPASAVHTELFLGPETTTARQPAATVSTALTCRFARTEKSVPLTTDQTVLEVAEAAQVQIQYACRQGFCGVCKVKLLAGEVQMNIEDGLAPGDKAAGLVLACQARALSDISIDA